MSLACFLDGRCLMCGELLGGYFPDEMVAAHRCAGIIEAEARDDRRLAARKRKDERRVPDRYPPKVI